MENTRPKSIRQAQGMGCRTCFPPARRLSNILRILIFSQLFDEAHVGEIIKLDSKTAVWWQEHMS